MKSNRLTNIMLLIIGVLILGIGCEYEAPTTLWNPDDQGTEPSAVIAQIVPANQAGGGVNEIEIQGTNFSSTIADNSVYFSRVQAEVISAEPTKLIVLRPNLVAEAITVKVVVPGALMIAEHSPYTVTRIVENFTEEFDDTGNLRAFEIDSDGNFYSIMRDRSVRKRAPGSDEEETIGEATQRSIGRLRFGQDGDLYYIQNNKTLMYHFSLETGTDELYATFPVNVNVFDYDENGNAYVAGNGSGLYVMKAPNDIQMADDYTKFNCLAVRVYNGAVYVLAQYSGADASIPAVAVWKNKITGNGTVSSKEMFLNWSASEYADATPWDIEFASDGAMYISCNGTQPIIKAAGGKVFPLYKGQLTGPATLMDWGNDNSLYFYSDQANMPDKNVYKLDMGQLGAPHYGR